MIVDIHSHWYPRSYIELLKARTEIPRITESDGVERFMIFPGETTGRPMAADHWDLDEKLVFMDRFGISQTVLSLGNPWLDPITGGESMDLARSLNEEFAALERRTDGRIVGLGVLPQDSPDTAAEVAAQVAATQGLYGVVNGTRLAGRTLDDPSLDPVWEVLQARSLPLLLHPHYGVADPNLDDFGHAFPVAMGFPLETTIAVARLVFGGVLQRFPRLKVIASHGGGTIPYLAGRLDAGWRSDPSVQDRLTDLPSRALSTLFLDAVLYSPAALTAAAALVGVRQLAFGTDHPFSVADPAANLQAIDEAFIGDDRDSVLAGSARALLGLPSSADS